MSGRKGAGLKVVICVPRQIRRSDHHSISTDPISIGKKLSSQVAEIDSSTVLPEQSVLRRSTGNTTTRSANRLTLVIKGIYIAIRIPVKGGQFLGHSVVPEYRLGLILGARTGPIELGIFGLPAHHTEIVNSGRNAVIAAEGRQCGHNAVLPNESSADQLRTKKAKIYPQRIRYRSISEAGCDGGVCGCRRSEAVGPAECAEVGFAAVDPYRSIQRSIASQERIYGYQTTVVNPLARTECSAQCAEVGDRVERQSLCRLILGGEARRESQDDE